MRKIYLLVTMLFAQLLTLTNAYAADPPKAEYDAAMAAISEGKFYLCTEIDGQKWYISAPSDAGSFVADQESATLFTISKATGGGLYSVGLNINPGTGYHFSNTNLSNSKAILDFGSFRLSNGNDRGDWERQVPYMNSEGKIAIRSCNVAYGESSWNDAGRCFWTYTIAEGDDWPTPLYSYEAAYIWEFEAPAERVQITGILNTLFDTYGDYLWDDMNIGTGPGQYADAESFEALRALVEKLDEYVNNYNDPTYDPSTDPNALTLEGANELKAQLDSLYQKILDSECPYLIPQDGYYRIIAHNRYKSTYDPSGFVDKAIAASFDKDHLNKAVYSTLDRERANFVWKLTQHGDSILIQNAGMGTFISPATDNPENKILMTEDESQALHIMLDYAGLEYVEPDGVGDEKDCFAIRLARSPRDASGDGRYVHQMNHASALDDSSPWGTYGTDSGTEQELGFWRRTYNFDLTRSDAWASEWFLEYVPDDEAQELIDAFEIIKNHDVLVAQNAALRAEVYSALITAKDSIRTGLIKTASQMSSPYSQNDIGNGRDGGDLSAGVLIDGDKSTYWHSAWQNTPQEEHYIQLSEMSDMVGNCEFYICERSGAANDRPNHFVLRGSNDPEADDAEWVDVAEFDVPNPAADAENTIPFYVETAYPYVRVVATSCAPSYRYFWHAAEIQIITVRDNPKSQFAALGELAEELEATYNANAATPDEEVTLEIYEALLNAYKAFLAGMVDPTELRAALAAYKNATQGVVEGTNPGQWTDTSIAEDYDALYAEVAAYDEAGRYTAIQNHKYAVMLKAMQQSVNEKVNSVETDKWYRIMYPTEEMYDAYGFSKAGGSDASNYEGQPYQWGSYVVAGNRIYEDVEDEEGNVSQKLVDVEALTADLIRENGGLYFMEDDLIEDKDASMFRFIERPQQGEADYTALFKEVKENMQMALDMSQTYTRGEALIQSAAQLSTNAPDKSEGMHIEYAVDGNPNTFWHSDYHKEYLEPGYLQVALDEPVSGLIQLEVTRRQGITYGHIVRMYVQGSNDGQNWTNIGYIYTPYTNLNETVASQPIDLGGSYSYLRFTLTQRAGSSTEYNPFEEITSDAQYDKAGGWTYFHVAEFQLYPVTPNNELSAAGQALDEAFKAANKVIFKDATADDFQTALQAYRAYRTDFNTAEGKDVLPLGSEKAPVSYAIQSKANGMFVYADAASSNNVYFKLVPTYFTYQALGYERSLLRGTKIDGTDVTYLHSQNWDHRLVTWNVNTPESNSALVICEADEEYAAPEGFTFYKDIKPGQIYAWTNSVTIENANKSQMSFNDNAGTAYTALGRFNSGDGDFLAVKEITTIPAGEPAFYIFEDTLSYDPEDDYTEPIRFTMPGTPELVEKGDTINGFIGSLVNHTLAPREIYFTRNYARCAATLMGKEISDINPSASSGYYISGPCAYLDLDLCPQFDTNEEYDFAIFLGESAEIADGVQSVPAAIEKVSQPGNVYSVDGKLLRTGATLSSLKALGKGMYILNGVKVLVK